MPNQEKNRAQSKARIEQDFEAYKLLLNLWQGENPIKTIKLQALLGVNALLVSAVSVSGGFDQDQWYLYATGMILNLIWTFSIGRTALFQDLWQARLRELQQRYPDDPRFSVLDSARYRKQTRQLTRAFGAIPSRWYLLFSPFAFAAAWLVILVVTR